MLLDNIVRWFYDYRNRITKRGTKRLEELYDNYTHLYPAQITEQQFKKLLQRISLTESDIDLHHPVKYKLFGKKIKKIMFKPCQECKGAHPSNFEVYAKKIMSDQVMKGRTRVRKLSPTSKRLPSTSEHMVIPPSAHKISTQGKSTDPTSHTPLCLSGPDVVHDIVPQGPTPSSALSSSLEMAVCSSLVSLGVDAPSSPVADEAVPSKEILPTRTISSSAPLSTSTNLPPFLSPKTKHFQVNVSTKLPPLSLLSSSINYGDQKVPQRGGKGHKRRFGHEEPTASDNEDGGLCISDEHERTSDSESHEDVHGPPNYETELPQAENDIYQSKKRNEQGVPAVPKFIAKVPDTISRALPSLCSKREVEQLSPDTQVTPSSLPKGETTTIFFDKPTAQLPSSKFMDGFKSSMPDTSKPIWGGARSFIAPTCQNFYPIPSISSNIISTRGFLGDLPNFGTSQCLQRTLSQLLPPTMVQNLQLQANPQRYGTGLYTWVDNSLRKDAKMALPREDPATTALPQVVLPLTQNLLRRNAKLPKQASTPEDRSDHVPQRKRDKTEVVCREGQDLPEWMTFTKWGRRPKRRRTEFADTS